MDDSEKKNIGFLIFQEILPDEGISKKILAQVRAFESQGFRCLLGRFVKERSGEISYYIGEDKIFNYGNGIISKFKKLYCFSHIANYLINHEKEIEFIYIRYTQFSNIQSSRFIKKIHQSGLKLFLEIPTFPYDGEFHFSSLKSYRILEERVTRKNFMSNIDRIITFSSNEYIFDKPTLKINNAIDPQTIPLREEKHTKNEFNLIGVADLSFWHGYDRIIKGIKEYTQEDNQSLLVKFHIVGGYPGGPEFEKLKKMVADLDLEQHVILYGTMSGNALDQLFNKSDLAVGCLGCHRKGITEVQSLKNVEYTARGIPFIYSEQNKNFDNQNFVLKCSPNETSINITNLIKFAKAVKATPGEIREYSKNFTWENQIKKVIAESQKLE